MSNLRAIMKYALRSIPYDQIMTFKFGRYYVTTPKMTITSTHTVCQDRTYSAVGHCNIDILTIRLKGNSSPIQIFAHLAASSNLSGGLSLLTKHQLSTIAAYLATHVAFTCMFNRLGHNRLVLTLGKVI